MKGLTFVDEDGRVLFGNPALFDNPAGYPDDTGFTIRELAENEEWEALDNIAQRLANCEQRLKYYKDLEVQGRLLKLPCKLGDVVYDVVLCDDGEYHIFEMKVCNINPFGDVRKGKVWNVYLEGDYTKSYRSFYDFEKTVFLTQTKAKAALEEIQKGSVL